MAHKNPYLRQMSSKASIKTKSKTTRVVKAGKKATSSKKAKTKTAATRYVPAKRIPVTKTHAKVSRVTDLSLPALQSATSGKGSNRAAMEQALRDIGPVISPSLVQAQTFRVDPRNYTKAEKSVAALAMDRLGEASNALSFVQAVGFPGFPTLSLLQQLPEYRSMCERFAEECVKAWGKVVSTGAATDGKLAAIETELRRIEFQNVVQKLIAQEQAFGRAHGCINIERDDAYLTTPLLLTPNTIKKGSFEGVTTVEAYWVSPNNYNSIDPSQPDFYKPSSWWMLGKEIHSTRLWTLVSRPVPDMLKPAYSFAGVSMTQLAMAYVDNWLRTRQSVSDTVKSFSVSGIAMDLGQWLTPGGSADLVARAQLINAYRDSRNLLLLDKNQEEFFQTNTPLSGLSELQAQAQEQQSSVSHIPLVILLGITPNGLNASSEGEFRAFYDRVLSYLKAYISPLMHYILQIVQLSLYGEVDTSIDWQWFPCMTETRTERAERLSKESETDMRYVEMGAVTNEQVQARLNADPDSPYAGIEASIDDLADDDIKGITEHILNIEPGVSGPQGMQHGQVGSPLNTEAGHLDDKASAISTPHSDPSGAKPDPTAKRNERKKMGV